MTDGAREAQIRSSVFCLPSYSVVGQLSQKVVVKFSE